MQAENHPDPVDRAQAEADAANEDAATRRAEEHRRYRERWAPALDEETGEPTGECACGCGRDVHPKRLELGYGLAIECAERLERTGRLQ